MECSYW